MYTHTVSGPRLDRAALFVYSHNTDTTTTTTNHNNNNNTIIVKTYTLIVLLACFN